MASTTPTSPISPILEDEIVTVFPKGVEEDIEARKFVRRPSAGIKREDSQATQSESTLNRPTLERIQSYRPEDDAVQGYPRLASQLGNVEGYAIFRKFSFLQSRNLLYHQAKLINLEHELNDLEQELAHEPVLHYSVKHLFDAEPGTPGRRLRDKHEEISAALDKYNRMLLDQRAINELPKPDNIYVDSIYNFINSEHNERPNWLEHPEDKVYAVWDDTREPVQSDLVTINRELRSHDPFTSLFTNVLVAWWHHIYKLFRKPDDRDLEMYVYTDKTLGRVMRAIVMVVASALPTCSIIALYFIPTALARLLFIVLFSGIFACALSFFAGAKTVEIFAASVALAGVQVVFVGTALGREGSG